MKKTILATAAFVVIFAGSAMAATVPAQENGGTGCPENCQQAMAPKRQLTAAQKARMDEMVKIEKELRDELGKTSPDKAIACSLHNKILDMRRAMSQERFEEMLGDPQMRRNVCERGFGPEFGPGPRDGGRKGGPRGAGKRPELTAAQKAKMDKMMGLRKQINDEFKDGAPDKQKVRSLSKQLQRIRNEMDDARIEAALKDPKSFRGMGFGPADRDGRAEPRPCRPCMRCPASQDKQ